MRKILALLMAMMMLVPGMAWAEDAETELVTNTEWMPGYINVMSYGACGTGAKDDIDAIQRCIDENPGKTIYFPEGDYRISRCINLYASRSHAVNLVLDPNARIYTASKLNCLLYVGDDSKGDYERFDNDGRRYVIGGTFDGDNVQRVIWVKSRPQLMRFENIKIINFEHYGFYADQTPGTYSADFELINSWICGKSSMSPYECTGVYCATGDNTISDLRIDGCVVAMEICSGGNFISKVHATLMNRGYEYTSEGYNRTIGFKISTDGFNTFSQCYADTFAYGWYFKNDSLATLSQCNVYYWYTNPDLNNVVISMNGVHGVTVEGCIFQMPKEGRNVVIESRGGKSYANGSAQLTVTGNKIDGAATLKDYDLINSCVAQNRTAFVPYTGNIVLMPSDMWMPVAVVKAVDRSPYRMTVSNEADYFDLIVSYDKQGNADVKVADSINTSGARFTFALGKECEDEFGGKYAYLYVKREGETTAGLDLVVSNLSIPREGDVFGHGLFIKSADGLYKLEPIASVTAE